MQRTLSWAYGVTTVPQRIESQLPRTLSSLAEAGFDQPWIFADGTQDFDAYSRFMLRVTVRFPRVHAYPNWILGLWELWLRDPDADRYAMFQDDLRAVKNLRQYLDRSPYPEKGYLNLFTFLENDDLILGKRGWVQASQHGRGAVGLVFDREAVMALLTSKHTTERMREAGHSKEPGGKRGWSYIDGGVVDSMKAAGWKEYVHAPSLLQHAGHESTVFSRGMPDAKTFPGEHFDALSLLG